MKTWIVQDNASGDVTRISAPDLLNALSEVLGNLSIDVVEEEAFKQNHPDIYAEIFGGEDE